MTKAAKAFGKQLVNFWSSPETHKYLVTLCCEMDRNSLESNEFAEKINSIKGMRNLLNYLKPYYDGLIHSEPSLFGADINRMKALVTNTFQGRSGGTWCHPDLVDFFARWLDTKFARFCDSVIKDLRTGKAELVITKPAESAVMSLPQDYLSALEALVVAERERVRLAADYCIAY